MSRNLIHSARVSPLFAIAHGQPQHKIDNDSREERDCQDGRTQPIVESTLSAHPNAPRAPMECEQGVDHRHHSDKSKESGADLSNLIAEVEKANGEAAEDDGEVEP
jgi:hypothetical protein